MFSSGAPAGWPRELIISTKMSRARRAHCTGIIFGFECFRLKLCGASRCVVVDVHSFQIDRQTAVAPSARIAPTASLLAETSPKPQSQLLISHLHIAAESLRANPGCIHFLLFLNNFLCEIWWNLYPPAKIVLVGSPALPFHECI